MHPNPGRRDAPSSSSPAWIAKTLVAAACFVIALLALKRAASTKDTSSPQPIGLAANVVMAYVGAALGTVLLLTHADTRARFRSLFSSSSSGGTFSSPLLWVLLFGAASFVGNALFFQAVTDAPNPGYVRALVAVDVVALTLLSVAFFGSRLTLSDGLGVAAVCGGIALISAARF